MSLVVFLCGVICGLALGRYWCRPPTTYKQPDGPANPIPPSQRTKEDA